MILAPPDPSGGTIAAMYDAFISYARADATVVESLKRELDERGLRVFIDRHVLRPGEEWPPQLGEALIDAGKQDFRGFRHGGCIPRAVKCASGIISP